MTLVAVTGMATGQVDVSAVNKPIELLNEANTDIENGDYKDAVQKLIAANRLNPKLREVYSSLNTACTHTNQISLLKEFLVKGKGIFEEDDELCYYLGNIIRINRIMRQPLRSILWQSNTLRKLGKNTSWCMLII